MVLVHCTYGVCWLMGNIVAKYHDFVVYNFQRGPTCNQVTTKGESLGLTLKKCLEQFPSDRNASNMC